MVACGLIAILASACTPTGDFGRVRTDPTLAATASALFGRASFNTTDQEQEMHRRIQRFKNSDRGAFGPSAQADGVDTRAYYASLQRQNFSSSRGRYHRLSTDIQADIAASPGVFRSICVVQELDRRRQVAADELLTSSALTRQEVALRRSENQAGERSFSDALTFRYDSYVVALEQLLVETPHQEAVEVDGQLSGLAMTAQRARDGRYCGDGNALAGRRDEMIDAPNAPASLW